MHVTAMLVDAWLAGVGHVADMMDRRGAMHVTNMMLGALIPAGAQTRAEHAGLRLGRGP